MSTNALLRSSRRRSIVSILALSLLLPSTPSAAAKPLKLKKLPPKYRQWVEEVDLILTKEERRAFLELREDRRRDAFIAGFWQARDPDPRTRVNEYKELYYQRLEVAAERFPGKNDDRVTYYLLHGEPDRVIATDCSDRTWPFESWRFRLRGRMEQPLIAVFYQPNKVGPYRLWRPADGHNVLLLAPPEPTATLDRQEQIFLGLLRYDCRGVFLRDQEELMTDFQWIRREGPLGPVEADRPPEPLDPEWLATFESGSTAPDPQAETLEATLEFRFEGDGGERVAVQGVLAIPPSAAATETLGSRSSYNFRLNGEVLRDGEVFESFRYRYDFPEAESAGAPLSAVFERHLRPGSYVFVLKLEDIHSGRVFHAERQIEVPELPAAVEGS